MDWLTSDGLPVLARVFIVWIFPFSFIDKIINAMVATVKSGLSMPEDDVLPGPIKLHSKAATVYKRAMDDKFESDRGIGALSAFALAASEENGRGHLVITAPTGGSAGVMPALVYGLVEVRKVPLQKMREGMLAAAAIGYLCKHHATLSAAEGGCQAEIGVVIGHDNPRQGHRFVAPAARID